MKRYPLSRLYPSSNTLLPLFKRWLPILGSLLAIGSTSCKKFVEINPPINQTVSPLVFSDDQSATSAITGLYSQMMLINNSFTNGAVTLYTGLSSDELIRTSPDASEDQFTQNNIVSSNDILKNSFWQRAYNYIYQANAILEGLSKSSGISAQTKQQIEGEAKFIRAFCYFYLINLFGDVPLITTTDYTGNAVMPRIPVAQVYQQVIKDAREAQELFSSAPTSTETIRPNKWAAIAFLARVYLYLNDWQNAEVYASLIIDAGPYHLSNNLNEVFLATNTEAIWQLIPVSPGINTYEGVNFIPYFATGIPTYVLRNYLLQAFEPGDKRKEFWTKSNVVGGQSYYYPYKYKENFNSTISEYYVMLRLAEQYLIRAEARAHQNKIEEARADINPIRNRAGLANTTANDASSLLAAIEQERRVEFFTEWGHRWLDLKRTGRINSVLRDEKADWEPTDALYPIPLSEIRDNPFLTQNPGY